MMQRIRASRFTLALIESSNAWAPGDVLLCAQAACREGFTPREAATSTLANAIVRGIGGFSSRNLHRIDDIF